MTQRELYAKGGLTRWYWERRDMAVLRHTLLAKSVLDVGCGEGITTEKVVAQVPGRKVLGIDNDPFSVMAAKGQGLSVWWGEVSDVPYRCGTDWDCILLLDVIEHLAGPHVALWTMYQATAPGGKLVVLFPDDISFFIARICTGKFKEAFNDYGHVQQWTPREMRAALQGAGYTVETVERLPLHWLAVGRKS